MAFEHDISKELLLQAVKTRFPTPQKNKSSDLSPDEKIAFIAERFAEIMDVLGLDLEDPSLAKTPRRVAKMYVNEIFSGLDSTSFPTISFIENVFEHDISNSNIIFMKVKFHSFCEHHFVPMNGTAYVAYLPVKKCIGLSKIPRIVHFFAKRPQVQERLTAQIADSLATLLETRDIAVSLIAEHFCVMARGIEDENSHAITNVLRGKFQSDAIFRDQFFEAINRQAQ